MKIVALFIIICLCRNTYSKTNKTYPSPLILIPGDGGSRAYSEIKYLFVNTKLLVWVNFEYMAFPERLTEVFKLVYNSTTRTTSDVPGSKVFFPGWGDTEMIEDLDEWKHVQTTYFSPLVKSLITNKFYKRNFTLRGAPYDFRKAPNENKEFVPKLKKLIEETYKNANNRRVVILGHSMGSLYSLYFFKKMSPSWKRKYIKSFVSVSGPIGGAVKALKLETSGDALGSPRDPLYFREMQRSLPSSTFLLPKPEAFGKNRVLIMTKNRNYTVSQLHEVFKDMDYPNGNQMMKDNYNLLSPNDAPNDISETYCIYGTGVPTDAQLQFQHGKFPDSRPTVIQEDGDGTVSDVSLSLCNRWPNVKKYTIPKADHMGIVGTKEFLDILSPILSSKHSPQFSNSFYNKSKSIRKYIVHIL